jgi:hypothetical protein
MAARGEKPMAVDMARLLGAGAGAQARARWRDGGGRTPPDRPATPHSDRVAHVPGDPALVRRRSSASLCDVLGRCERRRMHVARLPRVVIGPTWVPNGHHVVRLCAARSSPVPTPPGRFYTSATSASRTRTGRPPGGDSSGARGSSGRPGSLATLQAATSSNDEPPELRPDRRDPGNGIEDFDLAATVTFGRDPDDQLDRAIDDNERGLKDTIRVNRNEIVEIAVRFTTYSGRSMYHRHILGTKTAT